MIDPVRIEQHVADHYARVDRVNRDGWRMHIRQRSPERARRARAWALPSLRISGWMQRHLFAQKRAALIPKEWSR